MKLSEAQVSQLRAEFASHIQQVRSLSSRVPPEQQPEFQRVLLESLHKLQGMIGEADRLTNAYLTGEMDDINSVVLAIERADLALDFALKLRNKVLEAYQEIMRMPV